jgi:MFS family permease
MFFFTASYNLVIPEMNTIISNLNGADYKGWIIALFTISAGISRPFSGKLADAIGRKKVMLIGLLVCGFMSLLYPFCISVSLLLVLRFFHGFSTGFFPTGATALITDIIPANKRGAAMGIWGTFISLGMGVGQGFSTFTVDHFGANGMFFCALGLVVISYSLLFYTAETLVHSERFKFKMLALKKDEIIERNVIPVAIVMLMSSICSGIIFVLTPDISENLALNNKGSFFIYSVLSTIVVRLISGGISDRIGRRQTLLIGMTLLAVSMYLVGTASTAFTFQIASVLFGISTGICSPTLFAWTADLSPENRRGIGAGTMFIALELGICLGSIITNVLYQNKKANIELVFYFGTCAVLATMAYLVWHLVKRKSLT